MRHVRARVPQGVPGQGDAHGALQLRPRRHARAGRQLLLPAAGGRRGGPGAGPGPGRRRPGPGSRRHPLPVRLAGTCAPTPLPQPSPPSAPGSRPRPARSPSAPRPPRTCGPGRKCEPRAPGPCGWGRQGAPRGVRTPGACSVGPGPRPATWARGGRGRAGWPRPACTAARGVCLRRPARVCLGGEARPGASGLGRPGRHVRRACWGWSGAGPGGAAWALGQPAPALQFPGCPGAGVGGGSSGGHRGTWARADLGHVCWWQPLLLAQIRGEGSVGPGAVILCQVSYTLQSWVLGFILLWERAWGWPGRQEPCA